MAGSILTISIAIFVIIVAVVGTGLFLNYIMNRMFQPTNPPILRGDLPDGIVAEYRLPAELPWEVELQVRVWEPEDFSGRCIVLFHGWESSMGHFSSYIEHYQGKNYRVIAADLRSSGESDYETFVTSYDYIDDIRQVMAWIDTTYDDIDSQVVFGHSLGGVSLVVGLGMGIISEDYLDVLIVEGIYGHFSYLLDRVYEQGEWVKLFEPAILAMMKWRLKRKTHPDHPLADRIADLELMHPQDHLPNIPLPILSLHAVDDIVVLPEHQDRLVSKVDVITIDPKQGQVQDQFNQEIGTRVAAVRLSCGGHFKTSKKEGYFDILDIFIARHLDDHQ